MNPFSLGELENILLLEMSATTSRRVSYSQLETLWEFLNAHRDIAMGFNKSVQARENSRRLWTEVSEALNSLGDGAYKDWKGWSAYWVDFKGKLKRKCQAVNNSRTGTGGGPSTAPIISDIEKKFLSILGEDYGEGMPGILVEPNLHSQAPSPNSPSILLENQQDRVEVIIPAQAVEPQSPSESQAIGRQPIRRRRHRPPPQTREAARASLVTTNQQRADAEQQNSRTLESILGVLTRIAEALERIETRMSGASATIDL